jgi:hypothetical protein
MRPISSIVLLVGLALTLAACGPSKAERIAAFRQKCAISEFTPAQCELLVQLYAAIIDAKTDAAVDEAVNLGTGIAIGTATSGSK